MRFAISALVIVGIASAIGTIVSQNSPSINYVNQFGAFWAEVFSTLDLFRVYNAPWFLLIMALMLVSTGLCLVRNTPKMIRDMRAWRDTVRDSAYPAFRHRAEVEIGSGKSIQAIARMRAFLSSRGYRLKADDRLPSQSSLSAPQTQSGTTRLPVVVARKGATHRLGYIAAHLSIVVICLGGLLDSELPLKTMVWIWNKEPIQMSTFSGSDVPASARLPASTPSYRANSVVPEGAKVDLAVVTQGSGALLLDLPFELELKQFRIDYYPTGMPKLFASDVVLRDKQTGETKSTTIEVNKPLIHRGIAIYQSSFDDGGSKLKLLAYPMSGPLRTTLPIDLEVGQSIALKSGDQSMTLEVTGFKAINVENMGNVASGAPRPAADPFQKSVASVLSPAINPDKSKQLRNVGPAIHYKLRNASGQAKEFHVYMLPIELEGHRVYLAGVRSSPDQPFRYLRIPADAKDSIDEFNRLRSALSDASLRGTAARRFAVQSAPANVSAALAQSAERALTALSQGGVENLGKILEETVPEAERERAAEIVLRMLAGSFWELWQQARARDGLPAMPRNENNTQFAQLALTAVSDAQIFDAPLVVTLKDFHEVKASVFQVTRSPGKTTVYVGCLLLVLGIFAMLYVRERRIWVWLSPAGESAMHLRVAATTPRVTLDFEREFSSIVQVTKSLRSL